MAPQAAVSLDVLRAQIRELEGNRVTTRWVPSGVAAIDEVVGGLPTPGVMEICGAPGSGRTRLVLAIAARWMARHRLVAWVDLDRVLHPPALPDHHVVLRQLLVVRPPVDRAVWAAEQLLRSGVFPLVVVAGGARSAHMRRAGYRWSRAAEAGGCSCVVIRRTPLRSLQAAVRLAVGGGEVVVARNRAGGQGRAGVLPPLSPPADPWD